MAKATGFRKSSRVKKKPNLFTYDINHLAINSKGYRDRLRALRRERQHIQRRIRNNQVTLVIADAVVVAEDISLQNPINVVPMSLRLPSPENAVREPEEPVREPEEPELLVVIGTLHVYDDDETAENVVAQEYNEDFHMWVYPLGCRIKKEFRDGFCQGTITKYVDMNRVFYYYHVNYDDGDEEDLSPDEINEVEITHP